MIELYLTNSYGVTSRALYIGTYDELNSGEIWPDGINVPSVEELGDGQYDIYTLSGTKVNVGEGDRGTLPVGIY